MPRSAVRNTRDQQKHTPAPRAHPITHRTSERALSLCMLQRAAVPCVAVWCSVACCSRVLRRGTVCCCGAIRDTLQHLAHIPKHTWHTETSNLARLE